MSKRRITQAVWWPYETAFGGGTPCDSMEQALEECRKCFKLGYGKKKGRGESVIMVEIRDIEMLRYDPETDSLVPHGGA